jgi:hypothetical protein
MKRQETVEVYMQKLRSMLFDGFSSAILKRKPQLKTKWDKAMKDSLARVRTLRGRPDYRQWLIKARQELKIKPQSVSEIVEEGLIEFELPPRWLHVIAEDVVEKKFPRRYSDQVYFVGTGSEVDVTLNGMPIVANKWWDEKNDLADVYFSIGAYLADIINDAEPDIKLEIDDMISLGKSIVESKKSKAISRMFVAPTLDSKAQWYEMYQKEGIGYTEIASKEYKGEDRNEETRIVNRVKRGVHWYAKKFKLPLRDGRKNISKGISRYDIAP